jgi:hypothetical protein
MSSVLGQVVQNPIILFNSEFELKFKLQISQQLVYEFKSISSEIMAEPILD